MPYFPPDIKTIVDYLIMKRDQLPRESRLWKEIDYAIFRASDDDGTTSWRYGFLFEALERIDPSFRQKLKEEMGRSGKTIGDRWEEAHFVSAMIEQYRL